ncbi:MAG: hypothetical protein LBO06_06335 [Bacteroidales bacterium]|jgi:hypothetical protein|nr:hypothetical protein [Bacteroidales bacterium]
MKKILACLMLVMVFASCDHSVDFSYGIVNNCEEKIVVEFKTIDVDTTSMNIKPSKYQLLTTHVENDPNDETGLSYLKYLIVIRGNDTSKVDYIHNPSLWYIEEEGEWGSNWTYVTLTIDSSAFEN